MATILVTSNANSGDGTLRAALTNASSGDVIQPDGTTFPRGTACEIILASALTFPEGVTVDGAQTRIVLDCSGLSTGVLTFREGTTATKVDFLQFASNSSGGALWIYGTTTFNSCSFYGISAARGVFYVRNGATAIVVNSAIAGNCGTNDAAVCYYVSSTGSSATFTSCTLVGNVSSTGSLWNVEPELVNCKTTIDGLVAPPSSAYSYSGWTATDYQSWNLRFKSTSEQDARGALETEVAPTYDLDGNVRLSGGALGAYEAPEGVEWAQDGNSMGLTNATLQTCLNAPQTINLTGVNVVYYFPLTGATTLNFQNGAALGIETFKPGAYVTTLQGTGLFANVATADLTNVSGTAGVKQTIFGGGVTSFNALATDETTVLLTGTQLDSNAPLLCEYQDGNGVWQTLATDLALSETGTSKTAPLGTRYFRVYDGVNLIVDSAFSGVALGVQYSVVAQAVAASETRQNWQCVFEVIGVDSDNIIRVGQAVTILARVFDAFDETEPLLNTGNNVSAIRYTCERKTKEIFTTAWEPVTGHSNVAVDASALLETIVTSAAWTQDETGFNFSLVPDVRTNPLFPEVGEYRIVVTIELTTGNPVVFYVFISVVDSAS